MLHVGEYCVGHVTDLDVRPDMVDPVLADRVEVDGAFQVLVGLFDDVAFEVGQTTSLACIVVLW